MPDEILAAWSTQNHTLMKAFYPDHSLLWQAKPEWYYYNFLTARARGLGHHSIEEMVAGQVLPDNSVDLQMLLQNRVFSNTRTKPTWNYLHCLLSYALSSQHLQYQVGEISSLSSASYSFASSWLKSYYFSSQSSSIKHTGENLCSVATFPHFRQFQFLVQLPSSIKEIVLLAEVLGGVCVVFISFAVWCFRFVCVCSFYFFVKHLPERTVFALFGDI